jgi:hypothetical protein
MPGPEKMFFIEVKEKAQFDKTVNREKNNIGTGSTA